MKKSWLIFSSERTLKIARAELCRFRELPGYQVEAGVCFGSCGATTSIPRLMISMQKDTEKIIRPPGVVVG